MRFIAAILVFLMLTLPVVAEEGETPGEPRVEAEVEAPKVQVGRRGFLGMMAGVAAAPAVINTMGVNAFAATKAAAAKLGKYVMTDGFKAYLAKEKFVMLRVSILGPSWLRIIQPKHVKAGLSESDFNYIKRIREDAKKILKISDSDDHKSLARKLLGDTDGMLEGDTYTELDRLRYEAAQLRYGNARDPIQAMNIDSHDDPYLQLVEIRSSMDPGALRRIILALHLTEAPSLSPDDQQLLIHYHNDLAAYLDRLNMFQADRITEKSRALATEMIRELEYLFTLFSPEDDQGRAVSCSLVIK